MIFLLLLLANGEQFKRFGEKIGGSEKRISCNITCIKNEVCYEFLNSCFPKCSKDEDCSKILTVLHYPNKGICEFSTGKCYDCLKDEDCNPYRNETCNAKCIYNSPTLEFLCGNGNFCPSQTSCKPKYGYYECTNFSSFLSPFSLFLLLFLIF